MDYRVEIERRLQAHLEAARRMDEVTGQAAEAVSLVVETFRGGGKVLLAGNGGSAADAQHWAAEWVIRLVHHLKRPAMPAIALTTDSSLLTAGANDIGYENVFARQVEGLAAPGDLLILISTTGNSGNLARAAEAAREKQARVLGILGSGGGLLREACDLSVVVPSEDVQRIQEMHAFLGHMLCELSELALYGDPE